MESENRMSYMAMFISSLGVGITNPAAVIAFLFAFSYFGIDGKQGIFNGAALVLGVLLGTLAWWIILLSVTEMIKKKALQQRFWSVQQHFWSRYDLL